MRVFVYGSLMSGLHNHHYLAGATKTGDAITKDTFKLYDLGSYPAAVFGVKGDKLLVGEVYLVDDEMLKNLDRLESVGHRGGYIRTLVDLQDGSEAWIYAMKSQPGNAIVESGDWRGYLRNREKNLEFPLRLLNRVV